MKTLKNHLILFDAECPICNSYTSALVKIGMLEKDERMAYQDMSNQTCPMVDKQRAVNEIALVDLETGEVTYGIHSIFKLFAVAIPFFKPLFKFSPFIWVMSKLYAFIAFNRRVIAPSPNPKNENTLQPSFKLNYRVAFLLFTWIITSYIYYAYLTLIDEHLPISSTYFIYAGLIILQGIFARVIHLKQYWNYLGNMMTVAFIGALLLLLILLLSKWLNINTEFLIGYFILVEGLMLFEHIRRVKLLKITQVLTGSWMLYRIGIILILLY